MNYFLGSLVQYHAFRQIDAERCSLFFPFPFSFMNYLIELRSMLANLHKHLISPRTCRFDRHKDRDTTGYLP